MTTPAIYQPNHHATSSFIDIRGLKHHVLTWGDMSLATPEKPLLLMMHGWMDVAASFQFVIDALREQPGFEDRPIVAVDWRGFGLTDRSGSDSYWFADYIADLDSLIDALSPNHAIDLLGHSMGGNIVMLYAGIKPQRIRRLVNAEGFGMPDTQAVDAVEKYEKWIAALKKPERLKDYPTVQAVAERLKQNNPRIRDEFAQWLAQHWARPVGDRWEINADPAHKRPQPLLYRWAEVQTFFQRISAPVLFIEGDQTLYFLFYTGKYSHEEFVDRSKFVPNFTRTMMKEAGHMLHHDQPQEMAKLVAGFLA